MKAKSVLKEKVISKFEKGRDSFIGFLRPSLLTAKVSARKYAGQGTTEYAILVGVLVVIAILAITIFRPKIQELWDAIASGINGL